MFKYPRTTHIRGSRLQPGDEDLKDVPFRQIQGKFLVVEEKVDGANTGISFDKRRMVLQSRGHELGGGHRERQFDLFKAWASSKHADLLDILGNRFVMYGEWMFAKHTEFYDALPHYFLEFDIFDKESGVFLSTEVRHQMLHGSSVVSVPVLHRGPLSGKEKLVALIGPSKFKSSIWREALTTAVEHEHMNLQEVEQGTDMSLTMEGIYIKVEDDGVVLDRHKFVRPEFLTTISDSGTHWMNRPILPNQLAGGVNIFGE